MRTGILGGSFDPIHNAHLVVAQSAREELGLDRILFLVSGSQPLKSDHGATAKERSAMVKLAIRSDPNFLIDERELRRSGPSYTVDSLRELHAEQPGAELFLLLGSDAVAGLGRWREPEEITRLATIAVAGRPGSDPTAGVLRFSSPQMDISSSVIRIRAARGLSLTGWVPESVADYISGLDLYQHIGGAA